MKKFLGIVLAALMLATVAFAADITVTLDGEVVDVESYGSPATIVEGRTLVPLRAIFEALGASVEWDNVTRTVTSEKGADTISLTVGADTFYKNDEPIELDVPAQIINDRTMVPARAIAEAYGVGVEWDAATRTVVLTSPVVPTVELPEGTILYLTGENYSDEVGVWGENNVGITVVENPDKEGDKVLYLETNVTEKQAWNYLWYSCEYVPGQRYLITYSARPANDAFGNPIVQASFGTCVRTNGADKGVGSHAAEGGAWKNIAVIYTIPEDIDLAKDMRFGIFASPVEVAGYDHNLAWSFYLDNISVVPYDGAEEDGIKDASVFMGPTGAGVPTGFDIDSAAGVEVDLSKLSSTKGSYVKDKGFVFEAAEEDADSLVIIDGLNLDASKYCAVAVEFKKVSAAKAYTSQAFFTTTSSDSVSEEKSVRQLYSDAAPAADGFMVSYYDFSENAEWKGTVNMIRFDPGDGAGEWIVTKIKVIEK
ncbi:MAG: copper amine oxidase N-terminal domain-containing protein [Clostridia bacterium]|nr:copper amine oxidase N-terminal domain-containing protein [Clostridia bacterium]